MDRSVHEEKVPLLKTIEANIGALNTFQIVNNTIGTKRSQEGMQERVADLV